MKNLFTLLFSLLFIATSASAATYRCGNTFSEIPCEAGAKALKLPPVNTTQMPAAVAEPEGSAGPTFAVMGVPASESAFCKNLVAKKLNAEHWADTFQHPDNVRRAKSEAIGYDNIYFNKCYGR